MDHQASFPSPGPEPRDDRQHRPLSESLVTDEVIWALVDAAPDGILMADRDGRIVLVNRQTEELFDYDRSELLGRPVEELIPEHLRQMHRAHRTRFRAEPRTRPMGAGIELLARRRDGTEFRVEISLSPMSVEGELLVIAVVRDITERVEAEAAMRRVQELLDATRDGIYISDVETLRFTYVNQGAVDQVGYSREELAGMSMLHIAQELDEGKLRAILAPIDEGGASSTMFTTTLLGRDGTDIPSEILLQTGAGSTDRAFVCVVRDVRERFEAEEQLRRADQELRLLEDRERIARDLHDTVIQRLFAAGMTLQATASMLPQDAGATTRISVVIEELDETIRELRHAIHGLQARARPGTGLREEIARIAEEERHALGVAPRLRLEGEIDTVQEVVAEHLVATLREALSNVARHARASKVEIVVECGAELTLRVADDGVGVPPNPYAGGNGLRNMAERADQLGGRCDVAPGEDAGTVVIWSVPTIVPSGVVATEDR